MHFGDQDDDRAFVMDEVQLPIRGTELLSGGGCVPGIAKHQPVLDRLNRQGANNREELAWHNCPHWQAEQTQSVHGNSNTISGGKPLSPAVRNC
jgi:hypothetical protein